MSTQPLPAEPPETDPRALATKLDSPPAGLSSEEAHKRLEHYGPNELAKETESAWLKFLSYFWGPIPWMIEAAAILSGVVQHWTDLAIISVLLVINAVVGFWEEFQAGNTIAALEKQLAVKARVHRDGAWQTIPSRELVPGDRVRVRLGDIVPADMVVTEAEPMQVDQSALTGESLPVDRSEADTLYSGSVIRQGEADALVSATGRNTYFGQTAKLVQETEQTSHFQKAVLKIGDYLIVLVLALVVLILAVALFRGDPMIQTIQFALVLTVAAIPVAMPTVLSVTMAVGARRLAARQAIVSRLASIEELAGVDILCSDKTGTLTQNKLTLGEPVTVEDADLDALLEAAALASRREDDDPIDLAVLDGVEKQGVSASASANVVDYVPFDPVHKRVEATVEVGGRRFKVSKGAPQVILELADNVDQVHSAVEEAVDDFAERGFRSLGVARTDEAGNWQFLGVLPLFDPPRDDSRQTLEAAGQMGVDVKMVTGDQVAIGREIAGQLGLGTDIVDASALQKSGTEDPAQLAQTVEKADGFAQVFPEHKFRIVDALQHHGHIVGMTGDGVNDAPALKKADAGIAVSGATDAARSAADIVLITPGLSVVVDAIRESRRIFERMNSYALYRIAETLNVLLFMTLSILLFNFYPVTAVMIVLLALLNDGAILAIAYDRATVASRPEAWNMRETMGVSAALGVISVVATFGLFYLGDQVLGLPRTTIQTLMYLNLSVAGHLLIFVTRTRGPFWSHRPSWLLIAAVFGTQAVATLIAVYGVFMPSLGWKWAGVVWAYSLAWFLVNDGVKLLARRIFAEEHPLMSSRNLRARRR